MPGEKHQNFDKEEAQLILEAGWRQGSIFRPAAGFPVPIQFDPDIESLVVCTQSCTVVSPNLLANPGIEFVVARPVETYRPRSAEARGKNSNCFHLPINGVPNTEALACNINRRFFAERALCLTNSPDLGTTSSEESVRNFAGWIARYYTRIALPNELVKRAKGLFKLLTDALKNKTASGEELSSDIEKIYINWSPDIELLEGLYKVDILFLCVDADTDMQLNSLLESPLDPFTRDEGKDGIKLKYENRVRSETFISDVDGYKRLTEWDYLSNLGDLANSQD